MINGSPKKEREKGPERIFEKINGQNFLKSEERNGYTYRFKFYHS